MTPNNAICLPQLSTVLSQTMEFVRVLLPCLSSQVFHQRGIIVRIFRHVVENLFDFSLVIKSHYHLREMCIILKSFIQIVTIDCVAHMGTPFVAVGIS